MRKEIIRDLKECCDYKCIDTFTTNNWRLIKKDSAIILHCTFNLELENIHLTYDYIIKQNPKFHEYENIEKMTDLVEKYVKDFWHKVSEELARRF